MNEDVHKWRFKFQNNVAGNGRKTSFSRQKLTISLICSSRSKRQGTCCYFLVSFQRAFSSFFLVAYVVLSKKKSKKMRQQRVYFASNATCRIPSIVLFTPAGKSYFGIFQFEQIPKNTEENAAVEIFFGVV